MFKINWKIKAYLYRILSIFNLNRILFFVKKKITKRANIDIREIYHYWNYHLKNIKKFNSPNILEFGAGKSLEQNIFLKYKFSDKLNQTVIDVNDMLDLDLFNKANEQISKLLNISYKSQINSKSDIENEFQIKYMAPYKIEKLKENNIKFDACISSNTLEHLSVDDLKNLLINLKFIVKNDGIISFAIDYSDHFSHTDPKIGPLNFLKFKKSKWKKYNTKFLFQNRLRHQDYRKIFIETDYIITEEVIGTISNKLENFTDEFDLNNKETFALWGLFTLKIK